MLETESYGAESVKNSTMNVYEYINMTYILHTEINMCI